MKSVRLFVPFKYLLMWLLLLLFTIMLPLLLPAQQNQFYMNLADKKTATFNDAITLARLLYNERDDSSVFIDNVLWAASKKLFQVTIPINAEEINPIISRKEFAYWIWKIFNGKQGFTMRYQITRWGAYHYFIRLGILSPGRGGGDSFAGKELLETFAYLDYYVRTKGLRPKEGNLDLYSDSYEYFPEWRRTIYRELDEQQAEEKRMRKDRRQKQINRRKAKQEADKRKEAVVEDKIEELIIEE